MTFHLPAGHLSPDAPEVWGCPRENRAIAWGWVVDWFDLRGSLEGVSVASPEEVEWIEANRATVATNQALVAAWRIPF
jgi:hypothetical protein